MNVSIEINSEAGISTFFAWVPNSNFCLGSESDFENDEERREQENIEMAEDQYTLDPRAGQQDDDSIIVPEALPLMRKSPQPIEPLKYVFSMKLKYWFIYLFFRDWHFEWKQIAAFWSSRRWRHINESEYSLSSKKTPTPHDQSTIR